MESETIPQTVGDLPNKTFGLCSRGAYARHDPTTFFATVDISH